MLGVDYLLKFVLKCCHFTLHHYYTFLTVLNLPIDQGELLTCNSYDIILRLSCLNYMVGIAIHLLQHLLQLGLLAACQR